MTRLSSGNLYQPKLVGTAQLERLDDLMWPTYKRVTLEEGGDHYAEFVISIEDHPVTTAQLEQWFLNWIGCHFEETYAGVTTFAGYVHSLRIYVGGVMRQITLDDMWNRVYARYQTGDAAKAAVTSAANDTDSQAVYGIKTIVLNTGSPQSIQKSKSVREHDVVSYIQSAHADSIRDDFLDWHRLPHSASGDIVTSDDFAALEVYIQGYTHTVNWRVYNDAATTSSTVSARVTAQLGSLDFVTAGTIPTISTSCTVEADYVRRLDRIASLLAGENMQWGCFGGTTFDVTARDTTNIKYRRQAYGDRYGFIQNGLYVPEPLITPGGWLYTEDIFAGSGPQTADLRDDPRADWLHTIEYSIDGITAKNPSWAEQAETFAMSNATNQTSKQQPQSWIDRALVK